MCAKPGTIVMANYDLARGCGTYETPYSIYTISLFPQNGRLLCMGERKRHRFIPSLNGNTGTDLFSFTTFACW